jgi:hypothetical protein
MRKAAILPLLVSAALGQTSAPQLALSGNAQSSFDLMRGWPLIVKVMVMHSQRFQLSPKPADLVVEPASGAWYDAVSFSQNWTLKLAQTPDTSALVLPSRSIYEAIWQMSGDDTAALPPGKFTLTAHLEVKDGGGWTGAVDSPPVVVNIIDEPASLTTDQQAARALLKARYAVNQEDFNSAGLTVDALLADQPSNPQALAMRALLWEQAGDLTAAALAAAAASDAAESLPLPPSDPAAQRNIREPGTFFQNLRVRLWSAYLASFKQN